MKSAHTYVVPPPEVSAKSRSYSDACSARFCLQLTQLLEVQKAIHAVVRLETYAQKRKEACESVSTAQTQEQQTQQPIEDFAKMCDNRMKEADRSSKRIDPKRAGVSRDIAEMIRTLDGADDDIIIQGGQTRSLAKCPILSTDMKDPMKNELCGHVYSLQGALLLLAQTHGGGRSFNKLEDVPETMQCRCPIAGCSKVFSPKTLKRDYSAELSQRQQTHRESANDAEEQVDMLDD